MCNSFYIHIHAQFSLDYVFLKAYANKTTKLDYSANTYRKRIKLIVRNIVKTPCNLTGEIKTAILFSIYPLN